MLQFFPSPLDNFGTSAGVFGLVIGIAFYFLQEPAHRRLQLFIRLADSEIVSHFRFVNTPPLVFQQKSESCSEAVLSA